MATFLIADCHFGHRGIISLCDRPFRDASGEPDVRLMNQTMKECWNASVRDGDDVIVLGDFAYRMPADDLRKLFDSLHGKKHLVIGNHDRESLALPWSSPPRDILFCSVDSQRLCCSHYALRTWPGIRKGALNLFGHSHGRLPGNQQSMDVGVDVMGWAPVRLNQIKARLAQLPPLVDPEGGGDLENDGVKP